MPRRVLVRDAALVDHLTTASSQRAHIMEQHPQYAVMLTHTAKTHRKTRHGRRVFTHPSTGHAALGEVLLVAADADDFLVTWDKALVSDWLLADGATETLLMPLLALVLEFLHAYICRCVCIHECGQAIIFTVSTCRCPKYYLL